MSKELEALERLKTAPTFMGGTTEYQFCTKSETLLLQDYEIVKQALLELQSIKEANPSEALECLECLYCEPEDCRSKERAKDYDAIKNHILKSQEEHRSLEILKKNRVDIESFYTTFIDNAYNYKFYEISYGTYGKYKLTEEEFNLLKEVLE